MKLDRFGFVTIKVDQNNHQSQQELNNAATFGIEPAIHFISHYFDDDLFLCLCDCNKKEYQSKTT